MTVFWRFVYAMDRAEEHTMWWAARIAEVAVDVATNRFVFTTIVGSMMLAAWGPWWVFPTAVWAGTAVVAATCGWAAANRHQERRRRVLNQLQRARRCR